VEEVSFSAGGTRVEDCTELFAAALNVLVRSGQVGCHYIVLNPSVTCPGFIVFGFVSLAVVAAPHSVFKRGVSLPLVLSCFFSLCTNIEYHRQAPEPVKPSAIPALSPSPSVPLGGLRPGELLQGGSLFGVKVREDRRAESFSFRFATFHRL